ncbi:hypothetical protein ACF0H5_008288 [Mactra antiquata]
MVTIQWNLPWRTIQIGINVTTIVTGFCTFLPLSYVLMYFRWQCPIHANLAILGVNESAILVDLQNTIWGSTNECRYTTYSPLSASIHAFIWCWFFLLLKSQLKAEQKEFPLFVFSSILHSIMFVASFVSSSVLSDGINVWCFHVTNAIKYKGYSMSCSQTQHLLWPNIYEENQTHPINTFLRTAQISSWLQTLTILCQTLVCGYKLYSWIVATTEGYLDIRKCGHSPSLHSVNGEDNISDDNDNNPI